MFFKSKKSKVAKSIQSAVADIVNDKNLPDSCSEMTNSDESASYLYTEVLIQKIHYLVFVLDRKYRERYSWAAWEFVSENIEKGIINGLGNKDFVSVAMNGLSRLMNMEGAGPERINNIYSSSAKLVIEREPELNQEELVTFIDDNIKSFMTGIGKYFGENLLPTIVSTYFLDSTHFRYTNFISLDMNYLNQLRELALPVNQELSNYIKVHDWIHSESKTFKSILKNLFGFGIPAQRFLKEAENLVPVWKSLTERIFEYKLNQYDKLSGEEKVFFNLLSSFVVALNKTVSCMVARQKLLAEVAEKVFSHTWKEHQKISAAYEDSVNEYLLIGKKLNEVKHIVFNRTNN